MAWNPLLNNKKTLNLKKHIKDYVNAKIVKIASSSLFHKHLFWTNLGISVVLSGLGDIFIQHYENDSHVKSKELKPSAKCVASTCNIRWNPNRTYHMAVSFGLTSGFLCHFWYKFLDHKIPGSTIKIITRKILWDQIFFSPILIITCLGVAGIIDKSTNSEIRNEIREKGTQLYMAEWFIWPPAQFVNFYFLPTRFRVIYDNAISLGYDMYTSHVKNSNEPSTLITNMTDKASTTTKCQSKRMMAKDLYSSEDEHDTQDS